MRPRVEYQSDVVTAEEGPYLQPGEVAQLQESRLRP